MAKPFKILGSGCLLSAAAILILDARTASVGVKEGMQLCIEAVIPALFPFLFLSGMLNRLLTGGSTRILRPLGQLCRIPIGAEGILLTGLVGGYPVGATMVKSACMEGRITEFNAKRMLGFCNQAGPAFLFGMLGPVIKSQVLIWVIWGLQILSAIITAMLLPGSSDTVCKLRKTKSVSITASLNQAVRTMATVCGWVILFRVVLTFARCWILWRFPPTIQIVLSGFLELSNGCTSLSQLDSDSVILILSGLMLSFGGVCVGMQTASVCGDLGTGLYFPGKVLQCSINCLLSTLFAALTFPNETAPAHWNLLVGSIFMVITVLTYLHRKKVVAFFRRMLYNNDSYFYERG